MPTGPDGQPKYRGSGKDLSYFDDETKERFVPHVIEPSAGATRATLAFLCEAFAEEQVEGEVMTFDYRLRPGVVQSSNALRLMKIVGLEVQA